MLIEAYAMLIGVVYGLLALVVLFPIFAFELEN